MANSEPFDHIVFTEFDDSEGILVDLNTKKYYQLNETAMLIWKGLEQGLGPREIADQIVESYEITANDAVRNVDEIVAKFQMYSLVSSTNEAT
jgi:coenzyme PQQ synthesis protein D (PqqD)